MIDGGFRDRCCADVDGFFMIPRAIALTGRAGDSVFTINTKLCTFLIKLVEFTSGVDPPVCW